MSYSKICRLHVDYRLLLEDESTREHRHIIITMYINKDVLCTSPQCSVYIQYVYAREKERNCTALTLNIGDKPYVC